MSRKSIGKKIRTKERIGTKMDIKKVNQIYFSASGMTKKVVKEIAGIFPQEKETKDLFYKPLEQPYQVEKGELTIVGMPAYAGRIPALCVPMLKQLQGSGQPVIPVITYGNRDYEDALLELKDILEGCGFVVIAGGTFIARHSIFPDIAKERPNEEDIKEIKNFAKECMEKLESVEDVEQLKHTEIHVKGNYPYREGSPIPLVPTGDRRCTSCMACVKACPTNSISSEDPRKTNPKTCISCSGCIYICKSNARHYRGLKYKLAKGMISKKAATYRYPETFFCEEKK